MGVNYSASTNRQEIPFCVISFNWDFLHVVNGDEAVITILRNNLERNCTGIQKEIDMNDTHMFKLKGSASFHFLHTLNNQNVFWQKHAINF